MRVAGRVAQSQGGAGVRAVGSDFRGCRTLFVTLSQLQKWHARPVRPRQKQKTISAPPAVICGIHNRHTAHTGSMIASAITCELKVGQPVYALPKSNHSPQVERHVLRDNCRSRFDDLRGRRLLPSTRIMASRNDQSKHGNRIGLVTRLQHTAGGTHCWRRYIGGATTYLWSHCSCRGSLEFSFLRWIGPRDSQSAVQWGGWPRRVGDP
jgi:hypothetical protein